MENIRVIYKDTFDFYNKFTEQPSSFDYKIFFGDMNFRIDLEDNVVRDAVTKQNYKLL